MTQSKLAGGPGIIVISDHPAAEAAATAAAEQAAIRVVAVIGWPDALARIADQAAPAALLIETAGVSDDRVQQFLPMLTAAVGAARTIVAFPAECLDLVSAVLIGSEAILLCEPSPAERVAAIALALAADGLDVRDSRDEIARLARINAEVARFTEILARLTGSPQGESAANTREPLVGDRHIAFGQPAPDPVAVTPADLRRAIRARRLRDEVFGLPGLFEDPAWDMMLDLFAADLERRQVSVSSLCIAAAVAPTTALRWINKLIEVGLFERRPDEFDRRRAFVALTARAAVAMRDYVAALGRAGLAIA